LVADPDVVADVLILVKVINDLEEQLSDEIKSDFEREMQRLNSPDDVAADLVRDLLTRSDCEEVRYLIQVPHDVPLVFHRRVA